MNYEVGDKVVYVYSHGDYDTCSHCGSEVWVDKVETKTGVITSYEETTNYYSPASFDTTEDVIINPDGSRTVTPRLAELTSPPLVRFYRIDGRGSYTTQHIVKKIT